LIVYFENPPQICDVCLGYNLVSPVVLRGKFNHIRTFELFLYWTENHGRTLYILYLWG